ncbi:hypothetical protein PR048_028207 [Dryococelus australis]|uniref:VWFC domain-containing protein n=1 Tax=Dryococelus australis TaxID=614101 RepID=A0ABQ9GIM0_9NEOP|nr:hypothetical protein PR048_028207 [Dryococelus australis]
MCLQLGEIDCWPMECPPLTCSEPVLSAGDCCLRCDDDPCALDANANSTGLVPAAGQPCTYEGRLYNSGSQWRDSNDKCTACSCKVSASLPHYHLHARRHVWIRV